MKNFNDYQEINEIIEKVKFSTIRRHLNSSGNTSLIFNDGSVFRGNIINDFIFCHKNDFSSLFYHSTPLKNRVIQQIQYFRYVKEQIDSQFLYFQGILNKGKKEGYCVVRQKDMTEFRGFYENDLKNGFGILQVPNQFLYTGQFKNNRIEGDGTLTLPDQKVLRGKFSDGKIQGVGFIKYLDSRLEYFGEMLDNLREGKGVIKFTNNFKYEGTFFKDQIVENKGILINKKINKAEEGSFKASNDRLLGFFKTDEKCYLMDFQEGIVRSTEQYVLQINQNYFSLI